MARIGFIGLGNMGLPMAQNLLKAGHQIEGVDVNPAAIGKLTKLRQLEVFSNPLSGPLPSSLTKLTDLDVFRFDTTTLCVPSSLEAWLRSIATVSSSGLSCTALSMPQLPR